MATDDPVPNLEPLQNSAEANDVEAELKEQFIQIFEEYLRSNERELNDYGMPHLGTIDLIERHVKRDGLALIRTDEPSMKYLYRAWKARNPKRGMHFLRTYLQLLWPDGWIVEQLWQDKTKAYPLGLVARSLVTSESPHTTHYLTSRIRVSIDAEEESGVNIPIVQPALRAILAAKFVLSITVLRRFTNTGDNGLGVAGASVSGAIGAYSGEASLPQFDSPLVMFNTGISEAIGAFHGEAQLGPAVIP